MPTCPMCGQQAQETQRICTGCGGRLPAGAADATTPSTPPGVDVTLPYLVSPTRIIVMMVLSDGFYLFYWFYLTWKQHQDHTRSEAYPVWHALTLLVPVYGLFRTHAHMRTFRLLILAAGLPCTISAGWAIVVVEAWLLFQGAGGQFSYGEATRGTVIVALLLDAGSIALATGLLIHVQSNLNRFWGSLEDAKVARAPTGTGEVLFVLLGLLSWGVTAAGLLNPA